MSKAIKRVFRRGRCVRWELLAARIFEVVFLQLIVYSETMRQGGQLDWSALFWSLLIPVFGVVRGFFSEYRNDAELRLQKLNKYRSKRVSDSSSSPEFEPVDTE